MLLCNALVSLSPIQVENGQCGLDKTFSTSNNMKLNKHDPE